MKLIQDDKGNTSSMRVVMLFAVIVAAAMSFMVLTNQTPVTSMEIWLISIWLLVGIVGKNAAKFIEMIQPPKQ